MLQKIRQYLKTHAQLRQEIVELNNTIIDKDEVIARMLLDAELRRQGLSRADVSAADVPGVHNPPRPPGHFPYA